MATKTHCDICDKIVDQIEARCAFPVDRSSNGVEIEDNYDLYDLCHSHRMQVYLTVIRKLEREFNISRYKIGSMMSNTTKELINAKNKS